MEWKKLSLLFIQNIYLSIFSFATSPLSHLTIVTEQSPLRIAPDLKLEVTLFEKPSLILSRLDWVLWPLVPQHLPCIPQS